jgi:hypothetical protein
MKKKHERKDGAYLKIKKRSMTSCLFRPRQGKVKGKWVIQLNLLLPYSLLYPIATC